MPVRRTLVTLVLCLAAAAPAQAADPGRWRETGLHKLPLLYYQGLTHDPAGSWYFDGIYTGLWRTDRGFARTGENPDAIPPEVKATENYNHIGDISYDGAEGGRLLLPVECYYPPQGNTCMTGSIAVADPATLRWRYYVKLDPAEIPKAMWNEVSPDGQLIWTSSGDDLLAYSAADVNRRTPHRSARRSGPSAACRARCRPPASPERRSTRAVCTSRARTGRRSRSGRSTWPTARAGSRSSATSWVSRRASTRSAPRAGCCTG